MTILLLQQQFNVHDDNEEKLTQKEIHDENKNEVDFEVNLRAQQASARP